MNNRAAMEEDEYDDDRSHRRCFVDANSDLIEKRGWKSIIVPKRASTITLLIPLATTIDRSGDATALAAAEARAKTAIDSVANSLPLPFIPKETVAVGNAEKPSFLAIDLEEA